MTIGRMSGAYVLLLDEGNFRRPTKGTIDVPNPVKQKGPVILAEKLRTNVRTWETASSLSQTHFKRNVILNKRAGSEV